MAEWAMAHPWMTFILGCTAFWALVECARSITSAVALIITACSQAKAVAAAAAADAIKGAEEENEPLTEAQLLDMNGMPVFDATFKKWCLIKKRSLGPGIICVYADETIISDPLCGREYYRRPKEGKA